ncbi:group III truncated hemoglobin [Fulvivirga maritima]|uniref:group III truncated hemoglobin n=1 Tax=Fulvivirga maritima TaxID=2904247 RepID=UPI001F27757E|nr:group III truncated hemoglobin [Fulvivirga maritima]UII27358.1 group III truncated hemoglobin [Fulvivirga maritima]
MEKADQKHDILTLDDVKLLVNTFYDKVKVDPILGGIFNGVIQDRWPEHLDKMYRFWQSILLEENTYNGRPFPPHMNLPVGKEHFDQWLILFFDNIDSQFEGEKAHEAKWRAYKIAQTFHSKIEYFRQNS